MTETLTKRVLFLTGRTLSSYDYRTIEESVGAGLYIASGAGDALEQLIAAAFDAIVVVEGFGLMKLPRLLAAIRLHHPNTPVIVLGQVPGTETELFIRHYRPVRFLPLDTPLSDICNKLRIAISDPVSSNERVRHPNTPETPILDWISGRRSEGETEKSLQLTREVLRQVLHSSSQGLGIGSLITYFELLEVTAERGEGKIHIDEEIFSSIAQNVDASRRWLGNLERALHALTTEIPPETHSADALIEEIQKVLEEVRAEAGIRRHFIAADFAGGQQKSTVNAPAFSQIAKEILLNALRYSPEGSAIYVFAGVSANRFELRIENIIVEIHKGNDTRDDDASNLKKPFIRMSNTIDDRYTLNYGLGLGLTIAEYRIRQMGGTLDVGRQTGTAYTRKLVVRTRLPLNQ